MIEMSNRCFVLAGFLAILCTFEVMRRLSKNLEIKFPVCVTTVVCFILLIAGTVLSGFNI